MGGKRGGKAFPDQEKALIFRIVHVDNLAWILKNGLHCRNSPTTDPDFRAIGNPELIGKRARRSIPIAPYGTLSDYIPFYFTPRTPMLLNIKTGQGGVHRIPMEDIAILVTSLPKLVETGASFVFSNVHAYLAMARFSDRIEDLGMIDWALLQSGDFHRDPEDPGRFDRYQAEALVHRFLPIAGLLGIGCQGEAQRERVAALAQTAGQAIRVVVKSEWYFA